MREQTTSAKRIDLAGNDLGTDRVFMVKEGLLGGWVCAPKGMDEAAVQAAVHRDVHPSGKSAGWIVETRENDDPQLVSPGLCAEDCDRQHWFVAC